LARGNKETEKAPNLCISRLANWWRSKLCKKIRKDPSIWHTIRCNIEIEFRWITAVSNKPLSPRFIPYGDCEQRLQE
jgi:hypothetical protein